LTGEVLYGTLAMAAGWGLVLVAYDIPGVARLLSGGAPQDSLRPGFGAGAGWRLFLTALPLGLTFMLTALNANIPRYFFNEHDLGIFAAVASLTVLGTTFILSLGQASIARLARHFAAGDGAAFRRLLLRLLGLATLLGVAGLLLALVAGRPILRLLFTEEIAEHSHLLILLVAAAIVEFNAAILGVAVTATRAFKNLLLAYAFVAAAALALSFILIPALGLPGAAWALLGTNLVTCLAMLVLQAIAWRSKKKP
jgi:O-antigen/teichoic acid export membrane protein